MSWWWTVASLELRRVFSYRADFWFVFALHTGSAVLAAYFVWDYIFHVRGVEQVGGYTFPTMMYYFLCVPLIQKLVTGHFQGFLSSEIYQGTLNKYLVYPISVMSYKYACHLAVAVVALCQLIFAILIYVVLIEGSQVNFPQLVVGIGTAFMVSYLFFQLAAIGEFVAFWADNVWSLSVMLRFCLAFLGGGMLPLTLFPEPAQSILRLLPFSLCYSFPLETIVGRMSMEGWFFNAFLFVIWSVFLTVLNRYILSKGLKQYSGVGI